VDIFEILTSVKDEAEQMAKNHHEAALRAEGGAYMAAKIIELLRTNEEEEKIKEQEVV